jgi:hypothetical protein
MAMDPHPFLTAPDLRAELLVHIRERIRERFGDRLGPWAELLETEDGLEELAFRIECGEFGSLPQPGFPPAPAPKPHSGQSSRPVPRSPSRSARVI